MRGRVSKASLVLAGILGIGILLRLWGVNRGLPAVYNVDESAHFVAPAVGFFAHGFNPHYFNNPPLFSYLLHVVFWVGYGGLWLGHAGHRVQSILASGDASQLYTIGRVVAGLMGVASAGVLYFVGKKLFGVVAGLVAAAVLALTFLPISYGHLALNDVPALLPITLCMLAAVYVYETGSLASYLAAGVAVGIAIAMKYTAGAVSVMVAAAYVIRVYDDRARWKGELGRLVAAGVISVVAFLVANPYALVVPHEFVNDVRTQHSLTAGVPKLGLNDESGFRYYLWTLTWGFGWAPLAAAVGGAVVMLKDEWRKASLLLSFLVIFSLIVGKEIRFFARWFLPVYPVLALLAGYAVMRVAQAVPKRCATAVAVGLGVLLVAQGVATSVRNDRVLTREDTRAQAKRYLLTHVKKGAGIVVEPIATPGFTKTGESPTAPDIWRSFVPADTKVERYEKNLNPGLLDTYARGGYCVVVTGSTQWGRAFNQPADAPGAIAYYRRLRATALKLATFSPVGAGDKLPRFNFDWSFDYYPAAYHRPGPQVDIYKLENGACKKSKSVYFSL